MLSNAVHYVILILTALTLSAGAEERPRAWNELQRAIHSARELAENPALESNPAFVNRLRGEIEWLREDGYRFEDVMRYLFGPGVLESDRIRADLTVIYRLTSDENPDEAQRLQTRERLRTVGYHQLTIDMANFQLGVKPAGGGLESFSAPRAAVAADPAEADNVTLANTLNRLDAFEKSAMDLLEAQDTFHAATAKAQRRLFRWHALTTTALAGIGGPLGAQAIGYQPQTDREVVGLLFGMWAANSASYYALWQYTGWDEAFAKKRAPDEFQEVVDAWARLLRLAPKIAPDLVAAAARDKPVSTDTVAGNDEEAALEALLADKNTESTRLLLDLGLRSLEKGKEDRASRIFQEIALRKNDGQFATLTGKIHAVLKAKRRLEWRLFFCQIAATTLRVAVLGSALVYANHWANQLLPQWGTRWRAVVLVIGGYIQARSILGWLWQPPSRTWAGWITRRSQRKLTEAFRDLLRVDTKGEIVARLVQYRIHETSRELVLEAALNALRETPSGEITKTLLKMMERLLTEKRGPEQTKQARRLVRITAEQYRTCLGNLGKLVSVF